MSKNHSAYLKTITGVILIEKDGEERLCCLEDMQHTKHFTIGQIFHAISVLYGKTHSSYGKLWPRFKDDNGDISKDWQALQALAASCDSDYDIIVEACAQLNEEVPVIVDRETVEKRLGMFKENMLDITNS